MKRVLITGAEGPLGVELVKAFYNEGYSVTGVDWKLYDLENDKALAQLTLDLAGQRFDVVINNAKVNDWRHIPTLSHYALKAVVNIGSIYGVMAPDNRIYNGTDVKAPDYWYTAQKAAMIGLTRHLAVTLPGSEGRVRVNCVCPGGIFREHDPVFVNNYCERVPLRRMATEQDVVEAVLFLASEKASYITGQVLMVDGGLSAW